MKKTTSYLLALLCVSFMIRCTEATDKTVDETAAMTPEEMVKRGGFLISVGGCNDCHTPKNMTPQGPTMDMSRMLSGHPADAVLAPFDSSMVGPWILFYPQLTAAVGPWGTSYSANLTPHETGIKNISEEAFLNMFKNGKHLGMDNGRPIMPPMPWQAIAMLPEEDIKSIYAYLMSIPPIENLVPAYVPMDMH